MEKIPQVKYFFHHNDKKVVTEELNTWLKSYEKQKIKPILAENPTIKAIPLYNESEKDYGFAFECTVFYREFSEFELQQMAMRGHIPGQA